MNKAAGTAQDKIKIYFLIVRLCTKMDTFPLLFGLKYVRLQQENLLDNAGLSY